LPVCGISKAVGLQWPGVLLSPMKKFLPAWLALVPGILMAIPVAAGALLNGSFENGFLGWGVSGNASIVATAPYTPTEGTKLVAFNTSGSSPDGVVSQVVTGKPGRFHKLSFDVGNLSSNTLEQKIRVKVTGDGDSTTLLEEITIPGNGVGSTHWISREFQFFQASATQTISFEDISTTTVSQDLVLDNVRLDPLLDLHVSTSADSVNPPPGPVIDLFPASNEGLEGGNSPLAPRNYWQGTPVMLIAPDRANGWFFQRWEKTTIEDDNSQTTVDINGRFIVFTLDQQTYMKAVYLPGLTFEETDGFNTRGAVGTGPFTPSGKAFTIRNNSPSSLPWTAEASTTTAPAWFSVFPISGTLAPGGTVTVQLSVNPESANLAVDGDGQVPGNGIYHGKIQVSSPDLDSPSDFRETTLEVLPVLIVNTLVDENDGWNTGGTGNSLREALARANALNRECTTLFDPALAGGALILEGTELVATCDNTIDASAVPGGIMISANYTSRILKISNTASSTGPTKVKLDNITFLNGYAIGNTDGNGGAIHCVGSLDLKNCTFAGNWADGDGGAIGGSLADATFSDCLFEGNLAAGNGGGIGVEVSRISIDHSAISSNTAVNGGGIYYTGAVTITDSTISGNDATGDGGGIQAKFASVSYHTDFGALSLVNSTVANNHAGQSGGGIHDDTYDNSLVQCTVSGNTAGSLAGGIYSSSRKFSFYNTILAGNFGIVEPNLGGPPGPPGSPHEFVGYNLLDGDPRLAPLANYGGVTATMPPLPGSPAMDATLMLPSSPATDQRGSPRPSGLLVDIGATEAFPFSTLPLLDSDEDGVDDRLEPAYGLTVGTNDSSRDSDGDGSTDAMEIANMTNPLDSTSLLKITSFAPVPGFNPAAPAYNVTFTSYPGLSYTLQSHPGLDFSGPGAINHAFGVATGYSSLTTVPLSPGQDFLRVVRMK